MPSFSALVCLAFCGSIGMMFLFLACALPDYGVWWPFFVLFLYLAAPIPIAIAKRCMEGGNANTSAALDLAVFIVAGIVVSAFGLPLILARSHVLLPALLAASHRMVLTWKAFDKSPWAAVFRGDIIKWGAAGLVVSGNVVIFLTMLSYFLMFSNEDVDYSMW